MKYAIKLFNDGKAIIIGVHMSDTKSPKTKQEYSNCHLRVYGKNTHVVNNLNEDILLSLPTKDVVSTYAEDEDEGK